MTEIAPLDEAVLPAGIRSRFMPNGNGLRMHFLEAGEPSPGRPCVLLLHGFPELAYSWRKVMLPLAAAGFHVIAPDQRGYGRTTGWDARYDGDLASFRVMNLVRDLLGLLAALGYGSVASVIGHDFGAPIASWCALIRPDVFRSVAIMSAPFSGPPAITTGPPEPRGLADSRIHEALASLPRPRKHYQRYYSTPQANADLCDCPQGIHDFLRGYYHHKSADWADNRPFRLAAWSAEELARMPTYYIMDLDRTMAETAAAEMPTAAQIAACRWLPDAELRVYSEEYRRTGFQGGLQWYRFLTQDVGRSDLEVFSGRTIDVPSLFIAGRSDWGVYQSPGAFERMQGTVCTRMTGCHLIEGAGHWVQQEQPEQVSEHLVRFLKDAG
ncbi:MAG TPA: alpha/beta hydrolase [Acetobacteraceae bacterium]|nr:alpha/beta hydrolase [Acetobacteraceae bacterium]